MEHAGMNDIAPIHTWGYKTVDLGSKCQIARVAAYYFPDINIIENIWGLLLRRVFEGGRQFRDSGTLVGQEYQ